MVVVPVYFMLVYNVEHNQKNYVQEAIGEWKAYQYYYERERFVCNQDDYMYFTLAEDSVKIDGTIIPSVETTFVKQGNSMINYECEGNSYTLILSFDASNNLKIVLDGTTYSIFLKRV